MTNRYIESMFPKFLFVAALLFVQRSWFETPRFPINLESPCSAEAEDLCNEKLRSGRFSQAAQAMGCDLPLKGVALGSRKCGFGSYFLTQKCFGSN